MKNNVALDLHQNGDAAIAHHDGDENQSFKDKTTAKKDEPKSGQYNVVLCCCLWVSVVRWIEAISVIDLFSSFMYVLDVVTDIGSAVSFFQGKPPINTAMLRNGNFVSYNAFYNEEVCDKLDEYSHIDWALCTLVYVWYPCFPLCLRLYARLIFLVVSLCSCNVNLRFLLQNNMRHEVSELIIDILLLYVAIITWPIFGLIM